MKKFFSVFTTLFCILFLAGCGEVTYPKEVIGEAITKICKNEYSIDIDVKLAEKTLFIYLPLLNLFDANLSISPAAREKISSVLLNARRITFSTDADVEFYCVIAQDIKLPEIQLVIVRYVDDIKRAHYLDISLMESQRRMLIDINENPQAKKEQSIQSVFSKMKLGGEMREKVLDDFFRSPPTTLEGIGYWNGRFYVKNITFEEFLAQQMAGRVKTMFREKEPLRKYGVKLVKGKFVSENDMRLFLVNFRAEALLFAADDEAKNAMEREIFKNIFKEVSDAIYGYKYKDFNFAELIEENEAKKLLVSETDIYLFKKGKLGINAILGMIN